jgi:hypothetical protein
MGNRIQWNAEMETTIRNLREVGDSWDAIAEAVGVTREVVVRHATTYLGLPSARIAAAKHPRREVIKANRLLRNVPTQ